MGACVNVLEACGLRLFKKIVYSKGKKNPQVCSGERTKTKINTGICVEEHW
jgi:hypothetical protein